MIRTGRFSFILPVCLAIVLGGGWCVCPMAAQAAPKQAAMKCCAIDAASAIHDDSMDCCTTDCGQPGDRDNNNPDQPSWTVVDCLSCVFAGSKATVTLQIDSVRKPNLQPALIGILTPTQMTLSDRPFAEPAIASAANRAGSTLLGLRCALNL